MAVAWAAVHRQQLAFNTDNTQTKDGHQGDMATRVITAAAAHVLLLAVTTVQQGFIPTFVG